MKKLLTATCVLALSGPMPALANRVHDVSFQVQSEHAVIAVSADERLQSPRVRSEKGWLRVWFPGVVDKAKLTIEGDGAAIGKIALRPSGSKSALLEVELRGDTALPRSAVSAEADGDRFFLRIARSALPALHVEEGEGEEIPVNDQQDIPVLSTGSTERTEHSASEAGEAQPMDERLGLQRTPGGRSQTQRPLDELATAKGPMEGEGDSAAMTLWVMSALAAALGGTYVYLRKVKGAARSDDGYPGIHIVGSRRIGPRQQLILVRALGQDHLLLLNGDKAEHLTSTPYGEPALPQPQVLAEIETPAPQAPASDPSPVYEAPLVDEEQDYADLVMAAARRSDPVQVARPEPRDAAAPSSFEKDVVGLMRRMSAHEERPQAASTSPAVQGLLRLRREVG